MSSPLSSLRALLDSTPIVLGVVSPSPDGALLDASRALHGEARASYWVEFTAEVVGALPPDGAEGRARLLLFAKSSFC